MLCLFVNVTQLRSSTARVDARSDCSNVGRGLVGIRNAAKKAELWLGQNDRYCKISNVGHEAVIRLSRGRWGWTIYKVIPIVKLTTTGRKSGISRTVHLMSPVQEGSAFVLVASLGGGAKNPSWFLNLRDNPEVELESKGLPKRKMRARVANPEERARLWPLVVKGWPKYGLFQTLTAREIPLVLVEPREAELQ
jgi:deazaflavin-dependent oxidoreductase (nitroreductase family)